VLSFRNENISLQVGIFNHSRLSRCLNALLDEDHHDDFLKAPFGMDFTLKAAFQNRNVEICSYSQKAVIFSQCISDLLKVVAELTNLAASVFHFIFLELNWQKGKAGTIEIPLLCFSLVLCRCIHVNSAMEGNRNRICKVVVFKV